MKDRLTFETAIAEIIDVPTVGEFKHPFITIAKFILTDDKPNQNKQGIESEDFDEVIRSAIDMPVKMNFSKRTGLQNHMGSIPIGHIKAVEKTITEDGTQQLVANAVLWSDEYPDEIQFLREAHASGDSPKISYEMAFADSVTKDGNQWIKKITTLAATFVKTPAYGSRTSLLALASAGEISLTDLAKEIMNLAKAEEKINPNKGGNNVDEKDIKILQDRIESIEKERDLFRTEASSNATIIEELQSKLTVKDGELKTLTEQNESLVRAQLIDSRVRKLTEVGITLEADAERATKKKEFWASLSEEGFSEYVGDLVAAKAASQTPKGIALASLTPTLIPKPDLNTAISGETLLAHIKGLSRN